jgi:hypothetical protein
MENLRHEGSADTTSQSRLASRYSCWCGLPSLVLHRSAIRRCASWREADDATIADNFYRGQLNIFLPEISWNGPGPNYVGYEFQLITYMAALFYHLFGQGDWVGRGIAYPTEILGSTDSGVNFDAYSRNRLLYLGAPCIAFLPPLPCRR